MQGQLIARVGDARVEVGPDAYAALPRGVPHTIKVVGDQATLSASCRVGWSASWSPGTARSPIRLLSAWRSPRGEDRDALRSSPCDRAGPAAGDCAR
ncbi:hypothetical protein [Bradyrhizobium sp. SEMIA]|uniref:hypothetical protein n=1 Tax=Bradyrhizobium sp. SEMIA TaxID=2597515 RepID=UPI00223FEFC4|nr:hypothetical protein [Bradyrhizobium sp. SEMIA]